MNKDQVLEILKKTLSQARCDQCEAVVISQEQELTRFANSIIHQNTMQEDATLTVRAILGKQIGIASSNLLTDEAIAAVLERATTIARLSPANEEFVSLPGPKPISEVDAFVPRTAQTTPEERAQGVRKLVEKIAGHEILASGAYSTTTNQLGVANSLGVEAYAESTQASFSTVLLSANSAGYADRESPDAGQIDAEEIAEEALKRTLDARDPRAIEPKEMETVFLPYAVAEMLDYLAYMGLGAQSVQEQRSFVNDFQGKQAAMDEITIWDDGLDPRGYAMPFDFEGQPKRKVFFFDQGVVQGVVYDSFAAFKEGKESTGHALPQPNGYGALPLNMFMAPGQATVEEMIRSVKDGVLITRFWYVRPVHPKTTLITGMTRDGTFKIEDGKVVYPLRNLRFTASILETLAGVELIGKELKLEAGFFGGTMVPALKTKSFKFTGQTTF
jgi:predicted Zn-dependent protease